jgi:hypothetical protein
MLAGTPPMLVRGALANPMARVIWALMARGGIARAPAARVSARAAVGRVERRKVDGEGWRTGR